MNAYLRGIVDGLNLIADDLSAHRLVSKRRIVLSADVESQHALPPPIPEYPASANSSICVVCNEPIRYLEGVFQESGCAKHFGAQVAEALGHNKNTLNHIHLNKCYETYRLSLLGGARYCVLCTMEKPEHSTDQHYVPVLSPYAHVASEAALSM
jgi:hypothetical protein